MKANFLHLADVHLGYEQYGKKERADDFAAAFYHAVDYAIQQRVDFVVVAGDLFERPNLDPMTFDQALFGLEDLRRAGIPLIDIAGNHDRARYGQGRAWVESLALHGFLYCLDAARPEGIGLVPWSQEECSGSYLDLKGITPVNVPEGTSAGVMRFVGMRYVGASTARAIETLAERLAPLQAQNRPYTVALLHAGLDGEVPNYRAELTYDQLTPLRGLVDYVALGHLHKHYEREGWVYNPGSLENWNAGEARWEHGFLHVQVDTSAEPKHTVRLIEPPRRPFLRRALDVEPCRNPEELRDLVRRSAEEWATAAHSRPPVLYVTLTGRLRFDRHDLDLAVLESILVEVVRPLVVQLRDQTDETAFQPRRFEEGSLDRDALEFEVLRQLFSNDDRRVRNAPAWAHLAQALKKGALLKESPEALAELVQREMPPGSPLPLGEGQGEGLQLI